MTIATIMGTSLVFIGIGWTGTVYEPMALVVGSMVCIAAANAGATSQDLKTGYLVGATPKYQQLALFIGVIVSSLVIGFTVKYLDTPSSDMLAKGITHAIGTKYDAPQATLMATLIKGLLSFNLDWQFVLAGCFIAVTMELCGIKALSFAVGLYLPLSTTLPIWIGGAIRGVVDYIGAKGKPASGDHGSADEDLSKGSLFATGLVAGGALAGVVIALLSVNEKVTNYLKTISLEEPISRATSGLVQAFGVAPEQAGQMGYQMVGVLCFAILGSMLFSFARQK
jgi:putative OPT family oligopeptide transporter